MPLVRRRKLQKRNSDPNAHRSFISPAINRRSSSPSSSGNQSSSPFQKSLRMSHESGLKDNTSMEFSNESSDSTVEIKIKTLDLQTYSFSVNRNVPISVLKEEIVTKIGLPLEQQRLLYKGKVLTDDQLLSELNLEDGDTMHLAEKQPETSSNQGAGTENSQNTNNIQSDNPTNIGHILLNQTLSSSPFARIPYFQIENEPSLVPDALTTITEFIDRMEEMMQRNNNSWNNDQGMFWMNPIDDDLLVTGEVPTPEFLSFVLDRTEQLLRDNATTALSHLSTRLQRIDSSSDPVLRGQIQYGAMQLGVSMQHLGAMLLELGRITTCLRMGQTPEESFVRAGPAVYISPTGPNPRMIQLFPFQSSGTFNSVHVRIEQSVATHSTSQVLGSTTSREAQCHESTLSKPAPSGSESIQTFGAQAMTHVPNVQSTVNDMQSSVAQGFHANVHSETQFDMSNSNLQPPELGNLRTTITTLINMEELSSSDDLHLDMVDNGLSGSSENVRQSGLGENHVFDLAVSREVEQQASNLDWENANEPFSQSPSLISQSDFVVLMTNAMQSSAFSNVLSAVESQYSISTGDLRSVFEQCVRSPDFQTTFDRLVQQVGQSQDQENSLGTDQIRLDLTDVIQQLVPVVSQAVGRTLTSSAPVQDIESEPQPEAGDVMTSSIESQHDCNCQVDLGQAVERIEQNGDPRSIFGVLLEISVRLYGEQNVYQDIVELGNNEELANEFMEVLRRDIRCRLAKESSLINES